MPLLQTRGAASSKGLGFTASTAVPIYIEDVFSTWLYTGNASTETIVNGIDLSGKGGLVWLKPRSGTYGTISHALFDTSRGSGRRLNSNTTDAEFNGGNVLTAFNSNGFTLDSTAWNQPDSTYVSWSFEKQPKFFDVVTYTGTGANRTIAHNLGSVPGSIFVKRTDTTGDWQCYHRSLANTQYMVLNSTAAVATGATRWNSTTPTSAVFSLGTDITVNASGGTYVAYLFAHDAGGFGLTGTDNVISCGTFSGTGFVNLGWEPQWIMIKPYNQVYNWEIYDNMRGMGQPAGAFSGQALRPNTSEAEAGTSGISFEATGFTQTTFGASYPCIYIAIRRGPMKVPTLGTQVYNAIARTGTNAAATVTGVGFAPDLFLGKKRVPTSHGAFVDRLRGRSQGLLSTGTGAESVSTSTQDVTGFLMDGVSLGTDIQLSINTSSQPDIYWFFKRAPGFFDEVCYTGDGAATYVINHNLGVIPTLMIFKQRSSAVQPWFVEFRTTGLTGNVKLSTTAAKSTVNLPVPTATTITSNDTRYQTAGVTYVAYLFASCPGVSKVGSYTGNGTSQTIACDFTAGARFVLIKRTDDVGDWYVWDSVRGIVAGNDPHVSLNTTVAEVTTDDSVDTDSSGFIVNQLAATNINVSAASYIFLAIS